MKVLMNFLPVRAGGGQQVASNFAKTIKDNNYGHEWLFLVGANTELEELAIKLGLDYVSRPFAYIKRFYFENFKIEEFIETHKIDIIYHYAPTYKKLKVPQVIRSVYSNLYYPEIDFWGNYTGFSKLKKQAIDHFRKIKTFAADGIVFENPDMLERAVKNHDFPRNRTIYVKPSVSKFADVPARSVGTSKTHKILLLSSWHPNKNIGILPEVAKVLVNKKITDFCFVISIAENHPEIVKLLEVINRDQLREHFSFIGKVNVESIPAVVKSVDAVMLLSKLECFSSNVVEAWHFNKLLIISNLSWASSFCQDAALYVDRDSANDIAAKVEMMITKGEEMDAIIDKSQKLYADFSTPVSKVSMQVKFLEEIFEKGRK
jgi:hypothetical protein